MMRSPVSRLAPRAAPLPRVFLGGALLGLALLASPAGADAQRAPLPVCPLGSRLSGAREDGLCVRARQGLLGVPRAGAPAREGAQGESVAAPTGMAWLTVELVPAEALVLYRSAYPVDRNDGMLWGGRGASASLSAGLVVRAGHLTFAFAPEAAWSQNRSFLLPDSMPMGWSRFADPWGVPGLDRYLRPGADPLLQVGPGDSFVELQAGPVRAGVSTERLWWGPARRYAPLFSGTAEGFPHARAEVGAVPLGTGEVTVQALAGRLEESEWFDADEGNDRRLLAAGQAAWRLGFVPGLEVALAVARHQPWPGGDRGGAASMLGTFSFRAAFPDEGIEAYGELGRGDLFLNAQAGVSDTDHAQIYVLGFTRSDTTAAGLAWRVWGELTKQALELPQPVAGSADSAYAGPVILQGHTHRGQLLGSWIGPGSSAQVLGLDFPGSRGAWGVLAERVRRDDDTYYRVLHRDYGFRGHDLEWTLAARAAYDLTRGSAGTLRTHAEAGLSRRKNRSFVRLDGSNWTFVREWNPWLDLTVGWYPG